MKFMFLIRVRNTRLFKEAVVDMKITTMSSPWHTSLYADPSPATASASPLSLSSVSFF